MLMPMPMRPLASNRCHFEICQTSGEPDVKPTAQSTRHQCHPNAPSPHPLINDVAANVDDEYMLTTSSPPPPPPFATAKQDHGQTETAAATEHRTSGKATRERRAPNSAQTWALICRQSCVNRSRRMRIRAQTPPPSSAAAAAPTSPHNFARQHIIGWHHYQATCTQVYIYDTCQTNIHSTDCTLCTYPYRCERF